MPGATRRIIRDFWTGLSLLGKGFGIWFRTPHMWPLGMIPALISLLVLATADIALLFWLDDLVVAATPFADDWGAWRTFARAILGIAILSGALIVNVLLYTALTLTIGGPFYEIISRRVEETVGDADDLVDLPWWRTLGRSALDSTWLVLVAVLVAVPLFFASFVPILGQTVVPAIGVLIGGWLLALELLGIPFQMRGRSLLDRRRAVAAQRPLALGFGTGVFLLFLIPGGAVVGMPAAVCGAVLLARRLTERSP